MKDTGWLLVTPLELAALRVRRFVELYRPNWLYVDWSAGKDSSAALAAALRCCSGKVVATYLHLAGQTVLDNSSAALEAARRLGLRLYRYDNLCYPRQLREALEADEPWRDAPALLYVVTRAPRCLDYWEATRRYGLEAPMERTGRGKRWACYHMKTRWLAARPPNGSLGERPARFAVTGVRRGESHYRARLWCCRVAQVFGERYQSAPDVVVAPVVDYTEDEVWEALREAGVYSVIHRQYERWRRAPNCALCPLMGTEALERAVSSLPTGYLERVMGVLVELRGRYREGTRTRRVVEEWLRVISGELLRRGAAAEAATTLY